MTTTTPDVGVETLDLSDFDFDLACEAPKRERPRFRRPRLVPCPHPATWWIQFVGDCRGSKVLTALICDSHHQELLAGEMAVLCDCGGVADLLKRTLRMERIRP